MKQVDKLYAPQLPLEAAIVAGGGFVAVGGARGARPAPTSERRDAATAAKSSRRRRTRPASLAEKALADLIRLIEHFDRADTAYEAQRRPGTAFSRIYDYDDYAHLARLAEWETLGLEEEIW